MLNRVIVIKEAKHCDETLRWRALSQQLVGACARVWEGLFLNTGFLRFALYLLIHLSPNTITKIKYCMYAHTHIRNNALPNAVCVQNSAGFWVTVQFGKVKSPRMLWRKADGAGNSAARIVSTSCRSCSMPSGLTTSWKLGTFSTLYCHYPHYSGRLLQAVQRSSHHPACETQNVITVTFWMAVNPNPWPKL